MEKDEIFGKNLIVFQFYRDIKFIDSFDLYAVEFKYHSSWDWLMPVIEKCLKINEENLDDWEKYYEAIDDSFYQINIEQTFKEVLNFITWYNNQKRK